MGSATNKPDQHRKYESQYPALDNPTGLRILLSDLHALRQRRYAGDTAASDILIDLACAIERAGLTDRQRQAIDLVYGEDLTQEEAGKKMSVDRIVLREHVEKAVEAISEVYFYWSGHGEGYATATTKGETE